MSEPVNIGRLDDFEDGAMRQVVVKGEPVGIYRVGDRVFAIHDLCTHEETFLTEGEFDVDDLEVECPLHGSRFNVETGEVRILPATKPVATYETKIENGNVLVASRDKD